MDPQEQRGQKETRDHKAIPGPKEIKETRDHKEEEEQKEIQDHKDCLS